MIPRYLGIWEAHFFAHDYAEAERRILAQFAIDMATLGREIAEAARIAHGERLHGGPYCDKCNWYHRRMACPACD